MEDWPCNREKEAEKWQAAREAREAVAEGVFDRSVFPRLPCQCCQALVYECEMEDHLHHICQENTIPCLNHDHGCNLMVTRRTMATHLQTCIASTVVCLECCNSFIDANEKIGSSYRSVFRRDQLPKHYEDVHSSVAASESDFVKCPWSGAEAEDCCEVQRRMVPFNSQWRVITAPDGVQLIVPCNESTLDDTDLSESHLCSDPDVSIASPGDGVGMDRPALHRGLSKEEELSFYGYEKDDIIEPTASAQVTVPQQLSQSEELALYGYGQLPMEETLNPVERFQGSLLLDVPWEVCLDILTYLDSYSLRQMSLTSHYLRECCYNLLEKRGISQLIWQKAGDGWKPTKHFFFSTLSTFVGRENWKMVSDHMSMPDHTQEHCAKARRELVKKLEDGIFPRLIAPYVASQLASHTK